MSATCADHCTFGTTITITADFEDCASSGLPCPGGELASQKEASPNDHRS
jgi:hypothetical protein